MIDSSEHNLPIDDRHLARLMALHVLYEADNSQHDPIPIVETYANISLPADDARATSYMAMQSFYLENVEPGEDEDNQTLSQVTMLPSPDSYKMLRGLVVGVVHNREQIDEIIAVYAPEWPLDQIAVIDRNILRIALYEVFFGKNAPLKVVINEAVLLAKLYGAENASSFINGVLGVIADNRDKIEDQIDLADADSE